MVIRWQSFDAPAAPRSIIDELRGFGEDVDTGRPLLISDDEEDDVEEQAAASSAAAPAVYEISDEEGTPPPQPSSAAASSKPLEQPGEEPHCKMPRYDQTKESVGIVELLTLRPASNAESRPSLCIGNHILDSSHNLVHHRGVIFCWHCGAMGTTKPRQLCEPCFGAPTSHKGRDTLRRIRKGQSPRTDCDWPEPESFTLPAHLASSLMPISPPMLIGEMRVTAIRQRVRRRPNQR